MSFNQVLVILRARWLIATCVGAGIVFVVLVASLVWPKQYTASASVVIDSKTDPLAAAAAGGMAGAQLSTYVNTQADIISSERVAQRVVQTLHLDQVPRMRAMFAKDAGEDISIPLARYIIEKKLTVAPAHDSPTHASNVIDIAVQWSDPRTAAALANAFAQTAIDTNIDLKVEPAKQYASWFEQRSRALHDDLQAKQKRLSDFQSAHGIVATDEKLDVENNRLTELSTELVNIQGQRQDSQSRERQVGGDIQSLPEVLQSPVIQSLKAALAQSEAKRQDIASRLGKNHPDYQSAQQEVTDLQARISQESLTIAASLGSTTQVNVRRENEVRLALEAQKKKVLDLKHQHDEASVLLSDVTSAQRDLDEVTQRLARSNLESLTQQTNVVQLTTASAPSNPSSPQLVLNMLLGIFLGIVFGIATAIVSELRDRRVREDADMVALLGVPLLGRIGRIEMRPVTNRPQPEVLGRMEPSGV